VSLYHYIGSKRELPLGQRGGVRVENKDNKSAFNIIVFKNGDPPAIPVERLYDTAEIKEDEIEVYDSMLDLVGIYISRLNEKNMLIRKHFENPFVYMIEPSWGGFDLSPLLKQNFPEYYKRHVKCIEELFKLMQDYGTDGDEFELYSCWINEENEPRDDSLTRVIDLSSFTLADNFELKDKQYIKIKL